MDTLLAFAQAPFLGKAAWLWFLFIGIVIALAGLILYACGFFWMRSMMKVTV